MHVVLFVLVQEILDISLTKNSSLHAPCYSQSLLLADFTENLTLLWF
jgi:hypothetical protein